MFRCESCETYQDKSECMIDKLSNDLICWQCYAEAYHCRDCGEDKDTAKFNKNLDCIICKDCTEELEAKWLDKEQE